MCKKLLLASLLVISSLSFADSFKFGYVDVNKIFTTAKPAIALREAITAKLAPQQAELKSLKAKLDVEGAGVQALEKKTTDIDKLSSADRAKVEKFQHDQMILQQKYTIYQQTSKNIQDYASALLLGKANTILKQISDSGGYDLVLTSNQLIYAKPKYDLTDAVIEQLKKVNSDALVKQLQNADKDGQNMAKLQSLAAPAS